MTTPREPPALEPQSSSEDATRPPAGVVAEVPTVPPSPALSLSEALLPQAPLGASPGHPAVPGYEILAELGRGGMGVVYKARQTNLGRIVALKMILSGVHAGEAELARFRTEAEAAGRLQHPNIVQIHEIGEHGGLPFFSLEFCPGGSLEKDLDGTPWEGKRAATLVETLAHAVHAAHRAGLCIATSSREMSC